MSVHLTQVTIGSAATAVSATTINVSQVTLEGDDGNSNPAFVGGSGVTSATGIRLHNSATVPGRIQLGPHAANNINLADLYIAGTQNEKVNVFYTTI